MAEATFVLHGWLRSGNCTAARGAVEFLKEALARLRERARILVVRADFRSNPPGQSLKDTPLDDLLQRPTDLA